MTQVWFEFPAPITFSVTGKDSPRYLHNRLTVDIKGLPVGKSRVAAALTPQGKAEGLFRVFRVEEHAFLLSCDGPSTLSSEIKTALTRYIVADRVLIEDQSQQYSLRHFASREPEITGALQIKINRLGTLGTDLLSMDKPPDDTPLSVEEFELRRIRDGLPAFPQEVNAQHLFSEFEIPDSISYTKGCYVGQEVMEKIDAFGKAPRAIKRLILDQPVSLTTGTQVKAVASGAVIAQVLTAAIDHQTSKTYAFVSVRRAATESAVIVNNLPAILRELF